jgi:uncharacterized protein YaeQ
MAIGSTVYLFQVDLSDVDRGVYTELELRPALHPSESAVSLVARVLACCLEHDEQLRLGAGVGDGDEPAASIRDLTGRLQTWIDVGTPDAARLHKASKAADRVAVYCHKDPGPYLRELQGQKVHGSPKVHLYGLDRALVAGLAERLDRRQRWALSRVEGALYVEVGGDSLSGDLTPLPWG